MSGTSLGRLGGRQRRLAAAQRAYGALPPAQRRVLVARYVDGLTPAAIAARLGVTEAEVTDLIASARNDLLAVPRSPFVRPVALVAVGAALALTAVTRAPAPGGASPGVAAPLPGGVTHVVGGEPLIHVDGTGTTAPRADAAPNVTRRAVVVSVPRQRVPEVRSPRVPSTGCKTALCLPSTPKSGDSVHVVLPEQVGAAVGQQELVVEVEDVAMCDNVPSPPAGTARCVPGSS